MYTCSAACVLALFVATPVVSGLTFVQQRLVGHRREGALPETASATPLSNCSTWLAVPSDDAAPWVLKRHEAAKALCKHERDWPLMEVYLDTRFAKQYSSVYDSNGWVDSAWVNYVKVTGPGSTFGQLTEKLVESVHRFSSHPIVVVNFGEVAVPELVPERFPRLVLLHARGLTGRGISFNFNKLRAMFLASAKVGVSLDSDMVMVGPQGDQLFRRTTEEITADYPFPMLPTHFLDRDPRDVGDHLGNFLAYTCPNCPEETMRWGQAQPSWNYWSFPFLSRWLAAKLSGATEQGVPTQSIGEDEDLLNVALWREGATKAWCSYQPNGVNFLWENLYPQHAPGPYPYYEDKRYYPEGVPLAWYFGHAQKKVEEVDKALAYVEEHWAGSVPPPKLFFHQMKFYSTFAELKAEHPDVKCTM